MNSTRTHIVSPLPKTWIFDIDGTIVKHNGYLIDGRDTLLDGARDFFSTIPECDLIILLTSRSLEYQDSTETFLRDNGIRFDHIIFQAPFGERILVNDCKESGLKTAVAINTKRNEFFDETFVIDTNL